MPRTQPADVRRDQLLDAAERVLLEQGLRAMTVADVAQAAGVAKGTMYLYFRSKDELIAGLRARYFERYNAAIDAATPSNARERLRVLIVALFDVGVAHHELHHVLFHEAGFSEADAFAGVRDRVLDTLAEGEANGEFAFADRKLAASFLLHGVHGALVEVLHEHRPARRKALELAALVDRVVVPVQAAD